MKILRWSLAFFLLLKGFHCGNEMHKFVYVKCVASLDFFYPNYTCYARSQNRTYSAVNGYLMSKKPIYEIWVSEKLKLKKN